MSKDEKKRRKCLGCGKSLRRVDWYYRENNHFCNINCYKTYRKKKETAATA
ncbi:MAG: hypothetical protein GY858_09045 [Candidatus Omnitrophica bacterium]|nr:hypothetical protein [Candidatus Omnitrophota bacterium]